MKEGHSIYIICEVGTINIGIPVGCIVVANISILHY